MIGLGWWGKKMTAVLQKAKDDIEIVCAAEPDPAGKEFAEANGLKLYGSETEALQHPGVEAVILATPHSLHAEQIKRAVAARKHIFCEKPLALTRKEAEIAVDACAKNQLVLGMGHETRWEPPVAHMLAMARSGQLGRIQQVEGNFSHDKFTALDPGNWRLNASEAPVGGMTATGIHLTDLATALLGKARDLRVSCESLSSKIPQGDTMSVHIRFSGGGTAYVSASLAMPFISRFAVYRLARLDRYSRQGACRSARRLDCNLRDGRWPDHRYRSSTCGTCQRQSRCVRPCHPRRGALSHHRGRPRQQHQPFLKPPSNRPPGDGAVVKL